MEIPEQKTNPLATMAWEYTAIAGGAFLVDTALIFDDMFRIEWMGVT